MNLSHFESTVIEALSLYVVDGRLDPQVSIGEIISQTGLDAEFVNGAISRLMGRNWIAPGLPYPWTDESLFSLQGEGLARAAALAARRELTLFEMKISDTTFFISYDEPARERGRRIWTARAHRADMPDGEPEASATGITRAKARDALVDKLSAAVRAPCDPAWGATKQPSPT